jgi:hypothetical protein
VLVFTTLKMTTWVAKTFWWPPCNTITSIRPNIFVGIVINFMHVGKARRIVHNYQNNLNLSQTHTQNTMSLNRQHISQGLVCLWCTFLSKTDCICHTIVNVLCGKRCYVILDFILLFKRYPITGVVCMTRK